VKEPKSGGAESIEIIDNSAYVPRIDPTYAALGFLDEYLGRSAVEGGEVVEQFFPGERDIVPLFTTFLQQIASESGVKTEIRQEIGPQGHISVISPELRARLDALYQPDFTNAGYLTDLNGRKWRNVTVCVHAGMFPEFPFRRAKYKPEVVDCRFSFLHGCYARYGKGGLYELANATHKAELINQFLEQLGATWIEWSWTVLTVPRVNRIRFGPDPILIRALGLPSEMIESAEIPF
jgi:hypothetical protein